MRWINPLRAARSSKRTAVCLASADASPDFARFSAVRSSERCARLRRFFFVACWDEGTECPYGELCAILPWTPHGSIAKASPTDTRLLRPPTALSAQELVVTAGARRARLFERGQKLSQADAHGQVSQVTVREAVAILPSALSAELRTVRAKDSCGACPHDRTRQRLRPPANDS